METNILENVKTKSEDAKKEEKHTFFNLLKKDSHSTKLRMSIKGEDHTFLNLLKKELYNDKAIKYAGYRIEHARIGIPELILETEGKDPRKVLLDAVSRIRKVNKELLSTFKSI